MSLTFDRVITALRAKGRKLVRGANGGYTGCCPAHEDSKASLHVSRGKTQPVLLKCFAGCKFGAIVAALDLDRTTPRKSVRVTKRALRGDRLVAQYVYTDAEGRRIGRVLRYRGKRFVQQRWTGKRFVRGLGGLQLPLYRLGDVRNAVSEGAPIWIPEGEKDVRALRREGVVATTNAGGAGSWRPDHTAALRGARSAVVVADRDEPGRKRARQIAADLEAIGVSTSIVEAKEGNDAYDHFKHGHALTDFVPAGLARHEDISAILQRKFEPPQWLLDRIIARGSVGAITGAPGLGKSLLVYQLAISVAARYAFCEFDVAESVPVALLDLEMQADEVSIRLQRIVRGMAVHAKEVRDRVLVFRERLRLDNEEEFDKLRRTLRAKRIGLLIVDSFRRSFQGDENDASAVSRVFTERFDALRNDLGCAIVFIDHVRKKAGKLALDEADQRWRGSSDKLAFVDWHASLERREDGRLVLEFSKMRHAALPEPVILSITGLTAGAPDDGPIVIEFAGRIDPISSAAANAMSARVLKAIREAGTNGLLRAEIIDSTRMAERSVERALGRLSKAKVIQGTREGKVVRYRVVEPERPPLPPRSARSVTIRKTSAAAPKGNGGQIPRTSATSAKHTARGSSALRGGGRNGP